MTIERTLGLLAMVLAAAAAGADPARLAWLEGRWAGEKDGVRTEEHWTSPSGGALVGMHKEVKGGRMTSFEFLRIESTKEGGLVYLASPAGAPVTAFGMIALSERRVVFENRAHDFPQRILYWLDDAGALHARIEGTQGGQDLHEEWTWTKTP